jgi:hypothetical protein
MDDRETSSEIISLHFEQDRGQPSAAKPDQRGEVQSDLTSLLTARKADGPTDKDGSLKNLPKNE